MYCQNNEKGNESGLREREIDTDILGYNVWRERESERKSTVLKYERESV